MFQSKHPGIDYVSTQFQKTNPSIHKSQDKQNIILMGILNNSLLSTERSYQEKKRRETSDSNYIINQTRLANNKTH